MVFVSIIILNIFSMEFFLKICSTFYILFILFLHFIYFAFIRYLIRWLKNFEYVYWIRIGWFQTNIGQTFQQIFNLQLLCWSSIGMYINFSSIVLSHKNPAFKRLWLKSTFLNSQNYKGSWFIFDSSIQTFSIRLG